MRQGLKLLMIGLLVAGLAATGCARKKKLKKGLPSSEFSGIDNVGALDGDDIQLAALRGEDIPLPDQIEPGTFIEPQDTSVFEDVLFDYDDYSVKEECRPVVGNIAQYLQNNSGIQLMIEGHCDERGSREYNLALGEQRALSVRRYLVSLGIDPNILHTVSYGKERPLDPRENEQGWAVNRRAHFLISAE
ncbi:MAG: OmpA family protein [Candidatus Theseobacter exili]|nr:OmpA family protein [Candidatus Theseobacter exili]